jgi:hypothetical protein
MICSLHVLTALGVVHWGTLLVGQIVGKFLLLKPCWILAPAPFAGAFSSPHMRANALGCEYSVAGSRRLQQTSVSGDDSPNPLSVESRARDWLRRREPCLGLPAAGRDLAYIEVHGDAARDVIGGVSAK